MVEFKENVVGLQKFQEIFDEKKAVLDEKKKLFEQENESLVSEIKQLTEKIGEIKKSIEDFVIPQFKENKDVKKFYGGIGIQERKVVSYDEKQAFSWAKEKDMFLQLDKKGFEKAVDGLNLDFVEIDKEPKVTFPKVIKLED